MNVKKIIRLMGGINDEVNGAAYGIDIQPHSREVSAVSARNYRIIGIHGSCEDT